MLRHSQVKNVKPVQKTSVTPFRGLVSEKPLNIMVYTRGGQWRPRCYGEVGQLFNVPFIRVIQLALF